MLYFWKILTAQKHMPELVLYDSTADTLPAWGVTRKFNGAINTIGFGKYSRTEKSAVVTQLMICCCDYWTRKGF